MKTFLLTCVVLIAGCAFPPDEATRIQELLQAGITKGQVYLNHSSEEVSFVIRNSEYTKLPDEDRAKLVSSVEKQALELLARHRDFKQVKIYFLGDGAAGIKMPYICKPAFNACRKEN